MVTSRIIAGSMLQALSPAALMASPSCCAPKSAEGGGLLLQLSAWPLMLAYGSPWQAAATLP
jgi:hypothetical protein